ncbi:MAG TPA: Fe-S cluster assembly protein SufD [Candidatus Nanoarchaeia archaeon]|nr:Fe-S cluster assembly protein SufD [Candidatus Nanoarchaeia archaeon]
MVNTITKHENLISKNPMKELPQKNSDFAKSRKEDDLETFNSIPMPNEKGEDWRYTEIEKLKLENFAPFESAVKISTSELSESLISQGVILTDINSALEKYPAALNYFFKSCKTEKDKFVALSAAYFDHGIFLYVPKNIELTEPIRVDFEAGGTNSILHNLIIVESNVQLDFIEQYTNKETAGAQLNSCVTEVFANTHSRINFYHLNNWTNNVYNFTNIIGTADRNASINWISGCFGGKLNRIRIDTIFSGQGSNCRNIGIFMGKGKEHIDFTTNVYHNAENTTNDILVDGILRDESSSVYRGLIRIPKEGQKTNSYLANHILKLGDKTLANSIPSLKIDANDVKASHGATVGQIDEEHLFYLMARGLSRQDAEKLIIEGFFEPVINKIPSEELREKIRELVRK